MAFDPDAYLAEGGGVKETPFDPDSYLGIEKPAETSFTDKLQTATEELEAGIGRAGGAFAKSAVGSARMITDLFGANNKVSKEIAGVEDYIDQFTSAQAKQDKEEINRLFQEAEGKGLGAKVLAGLQAVAVSPETLGPEMAGYMLPSLAAGVLTGGASIPIQIGTQATIGAAQAAGSIKGDIYQSVRDYSREQGLDEVEADRAATEAQSYGGKNLDLILTNAGIGALAASTGAERIATRILTGRGQAVTKKTLGQFLKQGAAAGGVEALTEGTQEAAEQISQNIAMQRQGKDVPTFQNVPQVATMGAVAGGVIGGGLKGVEFLSAEEKAEQDINRSADREARSLSATDSTTKKVINDLNQSENAIDSLRQELDTLEPTDPKAQQLRMRISEEQKKATGLKQSLGEEFLSEPITEAEKQQLELAKAITTPEPAPTVKESLTVQPAPAALVSEAVTPVAAPVEQVVTPPVEVAPTIESIKETAVIDKDGKILSSPRKTHAQLMEESQFNLDAGEFPPTKNFGFVTTTGRFVLQDEAQNIASAAKQVEKNQPISGEIVSEINKEKAIEVPTTPAPQPRPEPKALEVAPNVVARFGENQVFLETNEKDWVDRQKVGSFEINQMENGLFFIEVSSLEEGYRGKGIGPKVVKELANQYGEIASDEYSNVSQSARSMWQNAGAKLEDVVEGEDVQKRFVLRSKAPTPAVSETITKPKLGEKGGVLIPTKEDFIQAGQNIYEAGMEFGAWAKQMIQRFGDAVREFLGEVWQAVSGAPAKLNELMGYLPKKGEAGAVNVGKGKTTRRTTIMSVEAGEEVETQEAIIARTKDLLRKQFDPTKVTEQNTTEAYRALGKLAGNRKEALAYAEELNDIGRLADKSGAASEISMGAALFVNDLFEYSIRLAAEGDSKMLGIMMANINRLPTAMIGASDAGRTLAARAELKARFSMMGRAEQDAYTNYVAEFIYGPNPTKEQIQSIKDAYAAVEKTEPITEQELTDEITAVGDRTGTDLVGKINEEFTKATEKGKEKRKTEEAELDAEYKKVQRQADAEIEKLAKIQSDTPSFDPAAARQITNDVRAIVSADLKQKPDMGRKAPWKSMLVAKLQEAGVELTAAETLADIVWRQHEINSLSRELSSINKAIEKGPISEIVKAIKDTPLEDQQKPNWRYEVMRDYLRKAGLPLAQAERIAKLMDISLQKRFTMAQEQAFTDAISKSAPWKAGDTRSRRAFQKVLQALRAGALDPARNVLSDMAALNGWTGFTSEQYKALLKNDAILSDPKAGELKKAEAYKAIQDVISKAKLPIRARNVIGQYYDAQALSGIPTLTVNAFSPIAFAMRNAIIEIGSGTLKGNPKAITNAATALVDSIKSWANTVAFSFKNNVTVYSNVDYIVNDDNLLRLYRRGVDQFKGGKTARERADGVKNMMIGMMDYVRRILNALDYGAIASLQNQNISKYSMAVMKRQGMSTKEANEMFAVMMKAKNDFYIQQIAIGTDKNKASILADEFYVSSWGDALTKAGIEKSDIKQAMDAAINDALSSVGRNRQSLDSLKDEATKLKDAGVSSMPALWLLESMANAANQSNNQILKLFSRVIYGFAIVPARVIRETAWFSPYGFVRFGYDAIAKKMGKTSPYAQSLGTDVQYSQRLNEAIAGTVALIALASLRGSSTDEPEEDEFKIVFTGNGPKRSDDPQFYDSWYKAGNKPNSMIVSFGKTKFTFNMMRGFEAFTWPAMMLGALDDLEIRKKQKRDINTNTQIEDASIVAGFVFDAALRRGPYAFTTKSLFGTYGDIGVEGVAKGLTFPAKTLIPVLGTSLASNLSNFINDPIDRRTLDGAVWSNIPFIGPAVAPKSLNAFGEPALSTDMASKMFKLGVPLVYDIPTDRESIKLHELVLKQGGGPSIPTRNQLAQRLDRDPTNKEYEIFVKEYGAKISSDMKRRYEELSNKTPDKYSKSIEKIGNRARDIAERKVREAAKKP